MFNNYLATIPQVADKLRTLGHIQPNPMVIPRMPMSSTNPANKDYWNKWRDEGIQSVYNGIQNKQSSINAYNNTPYYPKRSKNSSSQPFQTSQNQPSFSNSFVGGGNVTASSKLSNEDFETYRLNLMNNRLKELKEREGKTAPQDLPKQQLYTFSDDLPIELLLNSIEEKLSAGFADNKVYNDLTEVVNYYVNNIWKLNDVNVINNKLIQLSNIEQTALDVLDQRQSSQLNEKAQKDTQFIELFLRVLLKLKSFITENVKYMDRSQAERKLFVNSIVNKVSNEKDNFQPSVDQSIENLLQEEEDQLEQPEGEQPEGESQIPSRPDLRSGPLSSFNKDYLRQLATELGIQIYVADTVPTLRKILKNYYKEATYRQSLKEGKKPKKPTIVAFSKRENDNRLKNPLIFGLAGMGRRRRA